jgi:hypothetical protein
LEAHRYDNQEQLIADLSERVIRPAEAKVLSRFRVPEIVLGFFLGIVTFLCLGLIGSYQTQHCGQLEASVHSHTIACDVSGFPLAAMEFMDHNDGFVVGVFTFLLVVATILLWISTENAFKITKRAFVATERAFVFLDGFNVELTTALDARHEIGRLPERYKLDPRLYIARFAAQPRWKNGGNTPPIRMTIQINWRGPEGPIPPTYGYRNPPQPFFIAPKALEPSAFVEIPSVRSLVDYGLNPIGVAPMVFIWGRADYEDVFGQSHFVEWCYQVRLEDHKSAGLKAHFIQWGDYNRTDEAA